MVTVQILNRIATVRLFLIRAGRCGLCAAQDLLHKMAGLWRGFQHLPFGLRLRLAGIILIFIAALSGLTGSFYRADYDALARMTEKDRARYMRQLVTRIGDDPAAFLSLTGKEVRLLLAEPGLERREGAITVWQYRSDNCVLDVYLEAPPGRETQYVVDFEIRLRAKATFAQEGEFTPEDDKTEAQNCLRSVLALHSPIIRRPGRAVIASIS